MNQIKSFLFFGLLLITTPSSLAQKISKKPLNVVWISCEDMGPVLSAYGNKSVHTPNIDRLANEGIKYTNAYATVGVCAPSRFSIITGMYPARLGAHNMRTGDHNNFKWPEDIKLRKDKSANKAIGVYEIKEYLNQEKNLEEIKEKIAIKTRQYAKRQSTWARGNMISWIKLKPQDINNFLKKI